MENHRYKYHQTLSKTDAEWYMERLREGVSFRDLASDDWEALDCQGVFEQGSDPDTSFFDVRDSLYAFLEAYGYDLPSYGY